MARGAFAEESAKQRVKKAVESVEAQSSAEVVVAVRDHSGSYRHADLAGGALLSYAVLLYTLFSPQVFGLPIIALLVPASFALGALGVRSWPRLRLALAGRSQVQQAVASAARSTFVELAVASTRDRTGILIYVSLLERRVRVVADRGVKEAAPGASWKSAVGRMEGVLAQYEDDAEALDALVRSVSALGPVLSDDLPRRPDDTNELEDLAW